MLYSHRLIVDLPKRGRTVVFLWDSHREPKWKGKITGYAPETKQEVEFTDEMILEHIVV